MSCFQERYCISVMSFDSAQYPYFNSASCRAKPEYILPRLWTLETLIKITLTHVICCGRTTWPNWYKVNRSPQYSDWMMSRLLLNPSNLFSSCLPICLGLCKCPTTSFLTTNLGLNKSWNLNSRSSNPTGQISVNGIQTGLFMMCLLALLNIGL